MRGKLLFITGGLVGYVLGARAGRKRYDQIASAANELWNAKPVQRRVTIVRDFTLEAIGDLPVTLFSVGKKAVQSATNKKKATAKSPSASATQSPSVTATKSDATKSAAAKSDSAKSDSAKSDAAKSASTKSAAAKSTSATKPAASTSARTAKPAAAAGDSPST
ncbi:hypothetical protein [Glaciibacter psychrotolerans]|uniref:Type IV secretory pathway TrbL component n=1 Tax=Glaciibacter psychrotolerans TaxID=670054 RepID=A0A7Z0EFW4_9MICO|nr:hypothetical protein [Leifsonia psychrotolerans]NYJ20921.1 type IV secretory pathway TrbL component [Leifsonia psychrotolerans]